MQLLYLANSYFYNYKLSSRILHQHSVLNNLKKNKDIVITKPDKGNGVIILDQNLYDNAIQEIISNISKFESSTKTQPWNVKLHYNVFYVNWNKETFSTKMNMINCILLALLLLAPIVLLKCTSFPLVIHSLNLFRLFHL